MLVKPGRGLLLIKVKAPLSQGGSFNTYVYIKFPLVKPYRLGLIALVIGRYWEFAV